MTAKFFTAEQIHAELCYAESLLFQAVLTFTEDENLFGFVRGGLQIRSCYQSYKYLRCRSPHFPSDFFASRFVILIENVGIY